MMQHNQWRQFDHVVLDHVCQYIPVNDVLFRLRYVNRTIHDFVMNHMSCVWSQQSIVICHDQSNVLERHLYDMLVFASRIQSLEIHYIQTVTNDEHCDEIHPKNFKTQCLIRIAFAIHALLSCCSGSTLRELIVSNCILPYSVVGGYHLSGLKTLALDNVAILYPVVPEIVSSHPACYLSSNTATCRYSQLDTIDICTNYTFDIKMLENLFEITGLKHINFDMPVTFQPMIVKWIHKNASTLQSLSIYTKYPTDFLLTSGDMLAIALQHCHALNDISLGLFPVSDYSVIRLWNTCAAHWPCLRTLRLSMTCFKNMREMIPHPCVKSLYLQGYNPMIQKLVDALNDDDDNDAEEEISTANHASLLSLSTHDDASQTFGQDNYYHVIDCSIVISKFPHLRDLIIGKESMNNLIFVQHFSALTKLVQLKQIVIYNAQGSEWIRCLGPYHQHSDQKWVQLFLSIMEMYDTDSDDESNQPNDPPSEQPISTHGDTNLSSADTNTGRNGMVNRTTIETTNQTTIETTNATVLNQSNANNASFDGTWFYELYVFIV